MVEPSQYVQMMMVLCLQELSIQDPRVQAMMEKRQQRHKRLPPHIARLYEEELTHSLFGLNSESYVWSEWSYEQVDLLVQAEL